MEKEYVLTDDRQATNGRLWTVMAYMNGDNDLNDEMLWALKEMKRCPVGEDREVTVVALYDPGGIVPAQRYVINKVNGPQDEDGLLWDEMEEFRPGDGNQAAEAQHHPQMENLNTLLDFVADSTQRYPARHYMLVYAGHTGGALDDTFLDLSLSPVKLFEKLGKGLSKTLHAEVESEKAERIARQSLAARMEKAKKIPVIDILGFDSCLMSSIEILSELQPPNQDAAALSLDIEPRQDAGAAKGSQGEGLIAARYAVGAEGFVLCSGWPYQRILTRLASIAGQEAAGSEDVDWNREAAVAIVDEYIKYYNDFALAGKSVDFAAVDLRKCVGGGMLKEALKSLSDALLKALHDEGLRDQIILAHWRCQSYHSDQSVDLYDFCRLLRSKCNGDNGPQKAIRDACRAVEGYVKEIVVNTAYSGPATQHSHGISIYFPWCFIAAGYSEQLGLAQDTGWIEFLKKYVAATRREPRAVGGGSGEPPADPSSNATMKRLVRQPQLEAPPRRQLDSPPGVRQGGPEDVRLKALLTSVKNPPLVWNACERIQGFHSKKRKAAGQSASRPEAAVSTP